MTVNNVVNTVAYLRTSRNFSTDPDNLVGELGKSYIDTALAINERTIGIYPKNRPAITGNAWYLSGLKQQTLRQVYSFTTTANIPHGITLNQISSIVRSYGNYTDGTNWYGIISGSNVAIIGQLSFYLSANDIIFLSGVGAPALTSGTIVLEWLSDI